VRLIEERIAQMARERQRLAEELRFFDAGLWLGRPEGFPLARELTPECLAETLRARFLTGGLVSHWRGKTVSAQDGNEALTELPTGNATELFATWTGLPLFPVEAGPIPGHTAIPDHVKAVRLFPRSHNFPLAVWCLGSLCDWLAARQMPLFIWHTELDWPALWALARAFPALPIVVETQTQKILYHTRALFALLRECSNVSVELSNFAGQGFIEHAVAHFGAERLIFGSFLPVNDPLVPMGLLLDAAISAEEKALIAGGNLRRMADQVRP
jgi:hypothetical protein